MEKYVKVICLIWIEDNIIDGDKLKYMSICVNIKYVITYKS